jgi:pilus assembly protein CpaE
MVPVKTAFVIADRELRGEVAACLRAHSTCVAIEQSDIDSWPAFLGRLERYAPDVLLVDVSRLREPFEQLVARVKPVVPNMTLFAVDTTADPETILSAMRAGAADFILRPVEASLPAALARIVSGRKEVEPGGKAIGFLSAKGGCGATVLGCHFAAGLQRTVKEEVLLADFDVNLGTVGFLVKAETPYSILDAAANISRMDASYWDALVSTVQPGIAVLPAPSRPPVDEPPSPDVLRQVLRFARSRYGWTVVDLGRGLDSVATELLDEFEQVFLVAATDVAALYQAKRALGRRLDAGLGNERLSLILNRVSGSEDFSRDEVRQLLNLPVYAELPHYVEVEEAHRNRRLAAADSHIGRDLAKVAMRVAGMARRNKPPSPVLGLRRFLPRWQGA